MKNSDRYAESRGVENLGDMMDSAMKKRYGKTKEIAPFINASEGVDEFGKNKSISYGNSGETSES